MDFTALTKNLAALGYTVSCFDSKEEASDYLNRQLDQTSVGFGGSATVKQMGLYESLSAHNEVWWHAAPPEGMTAQEAMKKAAAADNYISGVNGIAETGEIVEIDNTGNRVASIAYGHKKVYLLVTENKVEPTFEKALWRARNVASPQNAKKYQKKTPCVAFEENKCFDCRSPERLCNILMVLWNKPRSCDYEILLIHENMGF